MPGNERYLVPGVYTSEKPMGGEPLQPAGSSAAAFIGTAEWGPMSEATLVTSWPEFVRKFGNDMVNGYLAMGARDFFRKGGMRMYIVRTCHYSDITDDTTGTAVKATIRIQSTEPTPADIVTVTALYYGTFGNDLKVVVENVDLVADNFDLVVYQQGGSGVWKAVERFQDVVLDSDDADFFIEDVVEAGSTYIRVTVAADKTPAEGTYVLIGGDDGLLDIADADYSGDDASHTGLYALDIVTELLTICHPGITAKQVLIDGQNYVYTNMTRRQIDLYLCDLPLGYTPQQALTFVADNLPSTGYEAIYYPWVKEGTTEKPVAPFVAGSYAYNDFNRGVWQAPAGVQFWLPVTEACYDVSYGDMQVLNPHGINSIERFQFEGLLIWGARTLDVHTHFRYLNVRRFVNVIKKTLQDGGLQFVFELNAPATWARVEDTAHRLMMYYHSLGAFAGSTPEESFFAKCDATTNPGELIDQGILTCVIGIAPKKPAEFIEFEIQLYNSGVLPIASTAGE